MKIKKETNPNNMPVAADAYLYSSETANDQPLASCGLWWSNTPALEGKKVAALGAYQAQSRDAASQLLSEALEQLKNVDCSMVIGPMNGDTWHSYRLMTEAGDEPPFLMEPWNPTEWPQDFLDAGFRPLTTYFSARTNDLTTRDSRIPKVQARLEANGIRIRPFRLEEFEAELDRIFDVSLASFPANYLYTPISREEFHRLYLPAKPLVHPQLVLIAEQGDEPVGYVFALPNAKPGSDQMPSDIIVKTLAVRPGRAYAGLGAWLLDEVHTYAHQLGFRSAIHALMHENNNSLNLSGRSSTIIRRYTLYFHSLA
ncbi:MAG: GNAT family N-acetyltransferase [Verrucomicrobiota bacterium]